MQSASRLEPDNRCGLVEKRSGEREARKSEKPETTLAEKTMNGNRIKNLPPASLKAVNLNYSDSFHCFFSIFSFPSIPADTNAENVSAAMNIPD